MSRENWPPLLDDGTLALIDERKDILEYRFGGDKKIITHKFFDEVDSKEKINA